MKFRHEWKHEISAADRLILRQRLSCIMQEDEHAKDGKYEIRSLYFDNLKDQALREKIDGLDHREKFRIRLYDNDFSFIRLEKKSKHNGLCAKNSCALNKEEAEMIVRGEIVWMKDDERELVRELYSRMMSEGLRAKTIVDYTREAFVYPFGNVRVTLDYDIRTGCMSTDFSNQETVTVPAGDAVIILEVKWDEYLPDVIRDAVFIPGRRSSAFSKYAQCRIYG